MIRKMLLAAVSVALPMGFVVATAGVASAVTVDPTGPVSDGGPAAVGCSASGGTMTLKYAVGYGGPFVPPRVNKGNQATISGIDLSCSPVYSSWDTSFTGVASGKITITDPSESPAAFYTCALFDEAVPPAGGTLSGSLKIKWTPPAGQKFSAGKTSTLDFSSIEGSDTVIGDDTYAQISIPAPGGPAPTVTGSFPGTDNGNESSVTLDSSEDVDALTNTCDATTSGLKAISFGTGDNTGQLVLA